MEEDAGERRLDDVERYLAPAAIGMLRVTWREDDTRSDVLVVPYIAFWATVRLASMEALHFEAAGYKKGSIEALVAAVKDDAVYGIDMLNRAAPGGGVKSTNRYV